MIQIDTIVDWILTERCNLISIVPSGWGIVAGLFAFGVISMCKDAVDK